MRLRREFVVHRTDGEAVLVPMADAGFSGIVRGNKTFGNIIGMLEEDTTPEEMVAQLCKRYGASPTEVAQDVRRAVSELRSIGALEE